MRLFIRTHIVSNHIDPANSAEVRQLVEFCIGGAVAEGIGIAEIELEYESTIEAIILKEILDDVEK